MVDVKKLVEKFEREYKAEKSREVEEIYNAIATVIQEQKAYRPHVIEALTLLLFEILLQKHEAIQKDRNLSIKEPKPIQ